MRAEVSRNGTLSIRAEYPQGHFTRNNMIYKVIIYHLPIIIRFTIYISIPRETWGRIFQWQSANTALQTSDMPAFLNSRQIETVLLMEWMNIWIQLKTPSMIIIGNVDSYLNHFATTRTIICFNWVIRRFRTARSVRLCFEH